jgi:hypothetical protein
VLTHLNKMGFMKEKNKHLLKIMLLVFIGRMWS